MPFGVRNTQATFERLMTKCLAGISPVDTYIDVVVMYHDTWEKHFEIIQKVFQRLQEAQLIINLAKSDFCLAETCNGTW